MTGGPVRGAGTARWRARSGAVLGVCAVLTLLGNCSAEPAPGRSAQASPSSTHEPVEPSVTAGPTGNQSGEGARLVSGVSTNGRHFVDEQGRPLLLRAETIWAIMQGLTFEEATVHLELRADQGFNAVLLSPFPWIGHPDDPGQTTDGLRPFDGSVASLDEAYWSRFDAVLEVARRAGITVFIAPGGMGTEFEANGYAYDEVLAADLGAALGARYRDTPGIVWLMGVDYYERDWDTYDPMMTAFVDGLRRSGDTHLATVQLFNTSTSSDNPRWRDINQVEAVYTYRPTYAAVLAAYERGTAPVMLIEANFEGENNEGGPDTTDETLRRQTFWTLTSGGVGVTYGELHLWQFSPGWRDSRETTAVVQLGVALTIFEEIRWWDLVPDADGSFLTAGRGQDITAGSQEGGFADVLESDRATAAVTEDGSLAVVYVPTARTISVDVGRLAPGVQAAWVDPTTGDRIPADLTGSLPTPGENAAGDEDWLLLITA